MKTKTDRQQRVKELRTKLLALTPAERDKLIASHGMIATIEGRTLSLHNTLFVYIQRNGTIPTIVGGYRQWQAAGQQVMAGEHGFTILFPVGDKDAETGDITGAARFYTGTVFDISQVQPAGESPVPAPVYKPQPKAAATMQTKDEIMKGWAPV